MKWDQADINMNTLERAARRAWLDWGVYAKWTQCSECGDLAYCCAARRRRRFLCFDCFDQVVPPRSSRKLSMDATSSDSFELEEPA